LWKGGLLKSMTVMKSPITSSRFDWLIHPEIPVSEYSEAEHDLLIPIPMPEEIGKSSLRSMLLPMEILLYSGYNHFTSARIGQLLPLGDFRFKTPEPVLAIQSMRAGQLVISDRRVGMDFLIGPIAGSLFHHEDVIDIQITLDCSENSEITVICAGDSVLEALLGRTQLEMLLQGLQIAKIPSACVNKVPRHIDAILHSSLPKHLTGSISKLFAQAKVLEYICALTEHVAGTTKEQKALTGRDKQLKQLHDELEALQGKVPSLGELALKYGMSARVLNDEFKRVYGSSIYTYISELRLTEAHEALIKTAIPMKNLAVNMGYSHVNHFISAFGKKFGYSPGSLRRKV